MTSIRRALATRLLLSLAAVALVAGLLLFFGVRAALLSQFDRTLMARLGAMQSATRWDGAKLDVDFTPEAMPWYRAGPAAEYFEIRSAGGGGGAPALEPYRAPSLVGSAWEAPFTARAGVLDLVLPDGRPGRAAVGTFRPLPEEELDEPGREAARERAVATAPSVSVAVGMSRRGLNETLRTIALGLLGSAAVLAVGLLVAVRSSVARGLAPLESLSTQVAGIRAESLSTRLDHAGLPDELRPIQCRLNELLARLDDAFSREQRFTAAASHELRTPVAELRALFEVALLRPRTAEEHGATLRESLDITLRAERLVATLLTVARGRAPAEVSEQASISPATILEQVAARHARAASERGGRISISVRSGARIQGDPGALAGALDNVLANAVEYADPAPDVECEVQEGPAASVRVTIRNPIRGLSPPDAERFFEPFWRRSPSRTPSAHLGMGLVIARSLVETMGGTVEAAIDEQHVIVRIELGRAEAPIGVPPPAGEGSRASGASPQRLTAPPAHSSHRCRIVH